MRERVGAGWGGCTISLVAEDDVEGFIQRVKAAYPPYRALEGEQLKQAIFATHPSSGAFGMFCSICLALGLSGLTMYDSLQARGLIALE